MDKFEFTEAMFTEEPLTVGEMLDLTLANDPVVAANPTLQAMINVVLSRYRGPKPMTINILRSMYYQTFQEAYQKMRRRIPSDHRTEVPKPFQEGMNS